MRSNGLLVFFQKHKDVMDLQERVDHLDSQQRHQLEELRSDPAYLVDRAKDQLNTPAGSVDSDHSSR